MIAFSPLTALFRGGCGPRLVQIPKVGRPLAFSASWYY